MNLGAADLAGGQCFSPNEEAIAAAGASVWWLPPDWPDFNTIEKLWSKIKSWLRLAMSDSPDGLEKAAGDAFRAVTPGECRNYLQHVDTEYD